MLFCACDSACWPFVCVMAVGVGVSGFWWRVFQWCVAVVLASRRVPGVFWAWLGVGCSVVCVGVAWVWVWWFRMLTCFGLFPVSWFLLLVCCLVNNGLCVRVFWRVVGGLFGGVWRVGACCCLGCGWVRGEWSCLFVRACCGCWFRVFAGGVVRVFVPFLFCVCSDGFLGLRASLLGCCSLVCLACACPLCGRGFRVFVECGLVSVVGECDCLGCGCVVSGGVLPAWLRDAVVGGGVSVGFDVGARVFVLSGVGVPAPSSGSGGDASVFSSVPSSGSASSPVSGVVGPVPVSGGGCVSSCGGVAVCVPCAVRVFGEGWCSLVLRRWARAAGVDVGVVSGLLSSVSGVSVFSSSVSASASSVSVSGSPSPSRSPLSISAPGSGSAPAPSSVSSRVGVGFGARVRDWGALIGVGGGVVSGGGVVAHLWGRARKRVRVWVSGVGVKGLVLAGLVGVVLLVSVLVLVG